MMIVVAMVIVTLMIVVPVATMGVSTVLLE
jgi:hypothetical protein